MAYPTLDIFMRALPFAYRDVAAVPGQAVRFDIEGEAGGVWTLLYEHGGWRLFTGSDGTPGTRVILDQETAWKLFSKGLARDRARGSIRIDGDQRPGEPIFKSLAVMA